jgi:hypothetical protein
MTDPAPGTRYAVFVDETMAVDGGYVPAVAYQDIPGYRSLGGSGLDSAAPWIWGPSLEQAKQQCRDYNRDLGLSDEQARDIRLSSMRASGILEVDRWPE